MASSTNLVFDITVIGAGVEGSSTAYRLSKMAPGKKLALVEQVRAHHSACARSLHAQVLVQLWNNG